MPLRASWTDDVSDHVMDAQAIAMRAIREDGVTTPTEQAMLDALYAAQERITEVDAEMVSVVRELTGIGTLIRTGKRPRRMLAIAAHD